MATRVTYTYTFDDFVLMSEHLVRPGSDYQRVLTQATSAQARIIAYSVVLTCAAGAAVAHFSGGSALWVAVVTLAGLLACAKVAIASSKRSSRAVMQQMGAQGLLGPFPREVSVELTESGVLMSSDLAEDLLKWRGLMAVEEFDNNILFVVNALLAHGVPARAFESPDAARAFAHEARLRLQSARQPLHPQPA